MNILVVAAHPDDEILGIGGTVKKHSIEGHEVYCVILGEGATSRGEFNNPAVEALKKSSLEAAQIIGYKDVFHEGLPDNRFDRLEALDLIKIVEGYIEKIRPQIVYTHHFGDINIDHRLTFEAVLTATRPIGEYYPKELYSFETISSTEWNFKNREVLFKPNVFVDISEVMDYKLKALECYNSEMREYPHPRSMEGVRIAAQKWGTVVSKKYVEPLELVRMVI